MLEKQFAKLHEHMQWMMGLVVINTVIAFCMLAVVMFK